MATEAFFLKPRCINARALIFSALAANFLASSASSDPDQILPRATSEYPVGLPNFTADWYFQKAYVEFGEFLFFSPALSTRKLSCSSCHTPRNSMAQRSRELLGDREAPPIINLVFAQKFMWDGRANTLESQPFLPLENEHEMDVNWDEALEELSKTMAFYLFSDEAALNRDLTNTDVVLALAAYMSSLVSADTSFDRYNYLNSSFQEEAKRGFDLFNSKANCSSCHELNGDYALFTDGGFHVVGLVESTDEGRGAITREISELGAFKTPTLRNIALTAPYFHDGSAQTLAAVMEVYNQGGIQGVQGRSAKIEPLNLKDDEVADIITFLESLTGEVVSYRPWLEN